MNRKLLFSLFAALSVTLAVKGQAPIADFTFNPAGKNCNPVVVNFYDGSLNVGIPTTYAWDFGTPTASPATSGLQNPVTTFNAAGTFSVKLTVTNANGSNSITKSITINPVPVVDFVASDSVGCFPFPVTFQDKSSGGGFGATITSYVWDLGGGQLSSAQNPSFVYKNATQSSIILTVTNSVNCSATLTKTKYINVATGVTPQFDLSATGSCKPPTIASPVNTSTGTGTMTYTWDFGDGSGTVVGFAPPHSYVSPGSFTIKLTASSSDGCTDVYTKPLTVSSANVVSSMSVPDSVCVNSLVSFQSTSNPQPGASTWKYGDGNTGAGNTSSHTYLATGTYTITLVNNYGTCLDSVSKPIHVLDPPVADFKAITSTVSCKPPLTVTFQDMSTNATSIAWDFGDGSPGGTGATVSHTYTTFGSFPVTVYATNASGCTTVKTKFDFVQVVAPKVHVSNLPAYGCEPYVFTPTIADTVVDGIASYSWDFGNGFTATGPTPPPQTYMFGDYTVKLNIVSTGGCTASDVGRVLVGNTKPTASFSVAPLSVCIGDSVSFTDLSTGIKDQWRWEFGDGTFSFTQNVKHAYNAPGSYIVKLIVYNHGCFDTKTGPTPITVNPPKAIFGYSYDCLNKNVYTFTDSSIVAPGANTYFWEFGDGATFSGKVPPPHAYSLVKQKYNVKLTVSGGGCSNTMTQQVSVLQKIDLTTNVSTSCKYSTVVATVSSDPRNKSYIFDFGDGFRSPVSTALSMPHQYNTTGTFTIKVIYTDTTGCQDSVLSATNVSINGPTVAMKVSDSLSCKATSITFTDLSVAGSPANPIVSWLWNFGDGTTSTQQNVTHPYTQQGVFSLGLTVTDKAGCKDVVGRPNFIAISTIKADFSNPDSLTCPGANVHFNNSSLYGFSPVYSWDFGFGPPYTGQNPPTQQYPSVATYTVKLKVSDSYGCKDSMIKQVIVDTPTASFTISDSIIKCPPATIHFKFTGSYYDSLTWNYGDGGIDKTNKLEFDKVYAIPDLYFPTLIVQSPGGCIAKATHQVLVQGPKIVPQRAPGGGCDTLTVTFTGTVTGNIIEYIWDFGDGTKRDTTSIPFITHFYNAPASFTGIYRPSVTARNDSNCSVTYLIDSVVVVGIQAKFTAKTTGCVDAGIQFNDATKTNGTITNYSWDFDDGTPVLSGMFPNPVHPFATAGFHNVKMTVTTQFGCTNTDSMVVKIVDNPQIDITGVLSQCVPATLTFAGVEIVPDTSALSWAWTFDNGQTSTLQNPVPQLYGKAGHYVIGLIATNSTGCADTATSDLFVYPLPLVYAGADTTICLGTSATLNAIGAATYEWLPPTNSTLNCTICQSTVATPANTTAYYVQGTTTLGCSATDTVIVNVNLPVTVTASPDDSVCIGQSAQLSASGAAVYAWTPANSLSNAKISNPMATPQATTNYQVIGSDNLYCFSDTQYVNITVFNYPVLNAGPDAIINVGSSYQMMGTGSSDIVSLNWTPTIGLTCTDCLTPVANPNNTTTYVLSATNNGGCTSADSMRLQVICNGANFFVPNTFSPNGDGVNDVFYVRGKGLNIIPSITIFNRWGQIVFQKRDFSPNDPAAGWDGTINGQKAPSDVYIFTLDIICDNSSLIPYHGNIALIR